MAISIVRLSDGHSTVAEHLTHNSKIEGLNPAADIGRERKAKV
jgi:hypothetical protein